ncbi:hypothetical protein GF318_04095 [Candidatus Micrarchaeota archaeon]|nr:hypothetical protein [Candidatus Micrarchaeota archaeon]
MSRRLNYNTARLSAEGERPKPEARLPGLIKSREPMLSSVPATSRFGTATRVFIPHRSPLRRFYYCKSVRGKWHRVERVLRGMRWNYYLYHGLNIPRGKPLEHGPGTSFVSGKMRPVAHHGERALVLQRLKLEMLPVHAAALPSKKECRESISARSNHGYRAETVLPAVSGFGHQELRFPEKLVEPAVIRPNAVRLPAASPERIRTVIPLPADKSHHKPEHPVTAKTKTGSRGKAPAPARQETQPVRIKRNAGAVPVLRMETPKLHASFIVPPETAHRAKMPAKTKLRTKHKERRHYSGHRRPRIEAFHKHSYGRKPSRLETFYYRFQQPWTAVLLSMSGKPYKFRPSVVVEPDTSLFPGRPVDKYALHVSFPKKKFVLKVTVAGAFPPK